jgi:hypothetical protein
MEAIFFAIDIVGMVLVLYWSIVNDKRPPGTPTTGLFAYRETNRRRPAESTRRASPPPLRRGPPPPPRRKR